MRSENTVHPWRCAGERLRWNLKWARKKHGTVKKTEQEGIIQGTYSDGWREVRTDKGTKKEQDSEKDRVRSENTGRSQQCVGERLK